MNLSPFKLERYFDKYEFTAKYILCASDCESFSIQELLAMEPGGSEQFLAQRLGYTETQGSMALRREVSRLYEAITPEEALIHSGGEEGIFLVLQALLSRNDHVIIHTPCYQSLIELARSIGCEITEWSDWNNGCWMPSADELVKNIRSETKAIIVNTPHNPTGSHLSKEDFLRINKIAEERGIVLFSDEAYREAEYSAEDRLPAACDISRTAVSLGVMSKAYGLPGLRIGWIATHNIALLRKVALLKDYTSICNSGPSEFLSEIALRHRKTILERNRKIMLNNLTLLDEFFSRHSGTFEWRKPKAGPIAFPRLLEGSVNEFCDSIVKNTGVLLLPGTIYDDSKNCFRIGFGRQNMSVALDRFDEYLTERV